MEFLKNANVARLIYKAIKAGNKHPSTDQLKTLALAVGDREAYRFLAMATVKDMVKIKTATVVFNGEAPKEVSEGAGVLFGMVGEKETTIASEDQKRIYDIKAVLKDAELTEEQKSMSERKLVEDKHPETSDRKTEKASVDEPLKEKTDPEFKKVLERGEKDPVEKRAATELTENGKKGIEVLRNLFGDEMAERMKSVFLEELEKKESGSATASISLNNNTTTTSAGTTSITVTSDIKDLKPSLKPMDKLTDKPMNKPMPDIKKDPLPTPEDKGVEKVVELPGKIVDTAPAKPLPVADKTSPKVDAVIDSCAERIKKGEDIKKVLKELVSLVEVTKEDHKAPKKPEADKPFEKKEPDDKKPEPKKDEKDSKDEKKPAPKKDDKEAKDEKPEAKKDDKDAKPEPKADKEDKPEKKKEEKKSGLIRAVINEGDMINMNSPDGGQVQVTFSPGGQDADGKKSLVGKDPAGNEVMKVPEGADIV